MESAALIRPGVAEQNLEGEATVPAHVRTLLGNPIPQSEVWLDSKGDQEPLSPGCLRLSADL